MEITNTQVLEILSRLEKKIDKLSNEVNTLKQNKPQIELPCITIEEWLEIAKVNQQHVNTLLTNEDGYLKAFKNFILNNNKNEKIPLTINQKKLDVFVNNDGEKAWTKCNDENLQFIIQETWIKFVDFYIHSDIDNTTQEDLRDLNKYKILQMRKILFETEKNKKEILKWFQEIL